MTCNNCHSPDCKVEAAARDEREAYDWLQSYGGKIAGDNWKAASEAEAQAQSDCAHRAAYSSQHAAWATRMAAIEARQDRIEAMLIAKGYEL